MMAVEIRGQAAFFKKLKQLGEQGRAAASRAVVQTTVYAQEQIVSRITALNLVDTGRLRSSFTMSFPNELTGVVTTNVEYAPVLEYGYDSNEQGPVKIGEHERKGKSGKPHTVKAHERKMVRKGRFFARDAAQNARKFFSKALGRELAIITKGNKQ
jgi:phage gpG-like protein